MDIALKSKYHQLFVTHCLASDSVLGEAGFSVRATSLEPDDPLLSIAMNLNAYELPMLAYDGARPYPWHAPIRLAAIPLKGKYLVAIMHSVYMETDTRGRPNSYFTHMVFVPKEEFSWRTTLKSWGAIQWELPDVSENPHQAFNPPRWITKWPNNTTNKLPPLESLPGSNRNDDHFIKELYEYYAESPKALEIVLGSVLSRLKKIEPENKDEHENKDEPIRGYLLPRHKIENGQCEGGDYPEAKPVEEDDSQKPKTGQIKYGENIRETLMQLTFIAWFFPEKLLTGYGFSTYEPHKYGVSITNDKLLIGIVHAKGELPNEMLTSQGVEYYPNVSSIDNKDKVWNWCNIQIDRIFKNKNETFSAYSQRLDNIYNSLNTTNGKWDHFDETNQIFDIIVSYNDYQTFDASIALLRIAKKNTFAKGEFWKNSEKALPLFLDSCYGFHSKIQNKEQLREALKFLFGPEFFDEVKICEHLTSKKFLQPENYKLKENQKIEFLNSIINSQLKKFLDKNNINNYKNKLLTRVYNLFYEKAVFLAWKSDPSRIFQLFHFFLKNGEKGNAENILLKSDYEGFAKGFIHRFKNKFEEVNWSVVLPCFMKASLQNKKVNKQIADLYKEDKFLILLQDIINDPKSVIWMPFIKLYQGGKGEECLTLANTLVNSKSLAPHWSLLEYLLTEHGLLTEIQIQDFLFSKSEAILKIIPIRGWSDEWLLNLVNQYLLNLDIIKLFSIILTIADLNPKRDSQIRVFSDLSNLLAKCTELDEKKTFANKIKTAIDAIVAVNRYAVDAPELFEINEFEKHVRNLSDYSKKIEKNKFRNQMIEYLASCVKKYKEKAGWYEEKEGKFILLLISLKSLNPPLVRDNLIEGGVFEHGTHEHLLPKCIPNNVENLVNVAFSGYKNGWIKNFKNNSNSSEFQKIQKEVAERFRKEYMFEACFYLWLGRKILRPLIFGKDNKETDDYQFYRGVTLAFILILFFSLPPTIGMFWGGAKSNNGVTLIGTEISNSFIFGLISLTWGFNAYFSKANNLAKSNKQNEKIINQMKFFVALWSGVGILLSLFFCFQHSFSCPFYAVLFIEFLWFLGYFYIAIDPTTLFLESNTCN